MKTDKIHRALDRGHNTGDLGDFTATKRLIPISLIAIAIGLVSSLVAVGLLRLIALFTNLFYFQRWSFAGASPVENQLGYLAVGVPVAGTLLIGLMARYGSERIRGHGIPEAIESILLHGSKVAPRLAILKPVVGHLHRFRRTVRRGRPDHHDLRCIRVDHRAIVPSEQHRAKDAARRGRRGRHVGDICRAALGGAARGRVAAV
jgi:hypothetical protein